MAEKQTGCSNELSESQGSAEESVEESQLGTRFKILKDVMGKTVKSFTRNLKLVKPIPNVDTSILKCLQNEVIAKLETNIQSEFDQMCEEENIEHLLNALDHMVEKNITDVEKTLPGWKPSGNVEADLCAHTISLKRSRLETLEKLLSELEAQNKMLHNTAEKKENRLIQTSEEISYVVNSLAQVTDTEEKALESLG